MGSRIFTLFVLVSKHLETSESVDLNSFSCLDLFQSVYYIIYMFQRFETPDMGSRIFTYFVSVCFETFRTSESVDLDIFACFNLFQSVYYTERN